MEKKITNILWHFIVIYLVWFVTLFFKLFCANRVFILFKNLAVKYKNMYTVGNVLCDNVRPFSISKTDSIFVLRMKHEIIRF